MTLKELREKRAKLIKDARAILDKADGEKRAITTEEQTEYDRLFAEADGLRSRIEREERQREAERELEESLGGDADEERSAGRRNGSGTGEDRGRRNAENDVLMNAFRCVLRGEVPTEGLAELRALSAGVNTEGGYIVVPEVFITSLIQNMDDEVIIRQLATVIPMSNGASIGIPTLDADPADADWTVELATGSEDSTMAFGKRVMQPHPLAKRIKISQQLLRIAAMPVETLVRSRLAYKFGISQEKAYMTGNGNKRPLGVFVASNDGIPTSRDVSTGNQTTAPTIDGLINAKYSLKAGYWNKASWIFHRDTMKEVAKIKATDGSYIWRESARDGEPDRLLGRPIYLSEYCPNTLTTGQYVGILGDFTHYWILDSLIFQLQRLNELYAETNQVGFIGRYEGDGAPVLAEAFARVKLA
jgi:HK97 family phage major capsid protein